MRNTIILVTVGLLLYIEAKKNSAVSSSLTMVGQPVKRIDFTATNDQYGWDADIPTLVS